MANKNLHKLRIDSEKLIGMLKSAGVSIRGLGRDDRFTWSEKTVRRAIHDGTASFGLVRDLAAYLNVDISEIVKWEKKELGYEAGQTEMWEKKMKKIIAVDFDGCLVTNRFPMVGEPIEKNIKRLKEEQEAGATVILWTCRSGKKLRDAIAFCEEHDIHLDKVNENADEIIEAFGSCSGKIFANEYWDDRAVLMDEYDTGDFSDGYHTFNELYQQRRMLTAALVYAHSHIAWKSHRHSDGEQCFGGGWFIVGFDTPEGQYTYHYENEHWDMFQCKEVEFAPEWDGHTAEDVGRLLSIKAMDEEEPEEDTMTAWAEREIKLACEWERANNPDALKEDWDYGCAIYDSALRALKSLCQDGHTGFSIQLTKHILVRMIEGKPLTPIEDTPDIWDEGCVDRNDEEGYSCYQCSRMSALFKKVYDDGRITYNDVDRVSAIDLDTDSSWHSGLATRIINEMFPITMPYMPTDKPFKVYFRDCLVDHRKGDYDTRNIVYAVKPDGTEIPICRYFKEDDNGEWVEISEVEYNLRRMSAAAREVEYNLRRMSAAAREAGEASETFHDGVMQEKLKKGRIFGMFKRSCEDPSTLYVCLFGRRYIFRNGKYDGWYRP